MPQLPETQPMDTSSFTPPPLDGSLSIPQIYDFHLKNSAACPLFVYTCSDGVKKTLNWGEFVTAIHGCTQSVLEQLGEPTVGSDNTVGILAVADSITYITHLFGIMRAGFVPFPLSTRNSADAVEHLLRKTGIQNLYVSDDPAMQSLVQDALSRGSAKDRPAHLNGDSIPLAAKVKIHRTPSYEDLYESRSTEVHAINRHVLPDMNPTNMQAHCIILHSSGTTSFPKAITYSHFDLLQFARLQLTGEMGKAGQVHAMHHIPMFHAMGITSLGRAAVAAMIIAVFEPRSPPILPTADRLIRRIEGDECTIAPCVPVFLETWASDPEAVKVLARLRAVIFAGGPLSQSTGDFLVKNGVQLHAVYGGTEVGTISKMIPDQSLGENWQYFEFADYFDAHLVPWYEEENVYELWALENDIYTPIVINDEINGKRAYATKDLVIRHPTEPHLWRVYGRSDDQIMLSTGEKTNPGPIEFIFCRDPRILNAVMFGRGRFNNGIILQLAPSCEVHPRNQKEVEEFKDSISELLEDANAFAPAHSKIYREMILIADPDKEFELTLKGSPRRHSILAAHSAEIEKAYEEFAKSIPVVDAPSQWTYEETLAWISRLLNHVAGREIPVNVDVFHQGLDSLHAMRLGNVISTMIAKSFGDEFARKAIPPTILYRFPKAESLARYLQTVVHPPDSANNSTPSLDVDVMQDFVNKLTDGLIHSDLSERPAASLEKEIVILTGSTGSLGSHILEKLCNREDVVRIYALNRGILTDLADRQLSALNERGIDTGILTSGKIVFITGDLAVPGWAIEPSLFEEMRTSVTLIIHTAWPVEFNYTLESFASALHGVRNLVDFSHHCTTRPRFIYTSSISVVGGWPTDEPVPAQAIIDPKIAAGLSYGQAKWVAERVLDKAHQLGYLKVSIIRLGQISGSPNGAWNAHEWFPSVCQVGKAIGCLPVLKTSASWLPTDIAASFVVDVKNCPASYLNLAHPTPFSLTDTVKLISVKLNLPLVSFKEWMDRLRTYQHHPSQRSEDLNIRARVAMLTQFFGGSEELHPEPKLDVSASLEYSPTLSKQVGGLPGDEEITRWLKYWRLT